MHNKLRAGVDLELAFKSQMRRLALDPSQIRDIADPRSHDNVASKAFRARAGMALRSAMRAVVRRVKPVLARTVSPLRRYLIAPMQEETQALRTKLQEEMQALRTKLQHEIRTQVAELTARLDRRVMVACGPDEVLVRSDVGYVLCSPRDYALVTGLLEGELERGTRRLIQKLLGPGDVFMDVGANIGVHTLAAARAMQGVGRIVAFEPCESTKRLLEKTVGLNGFSGIVEIHPAAGSSRSGCQQSLLEATSDHHGLSSVSRPADMRGAQVDVHCVTLDEFTASNPVVTLIRIDAHGAELDVLGGSESLIRQNENLALMVKFGPAHVRRAGHTTRDWLSRFEALGLAYRVIDHETGVPESWPEQTLDRVESVDLLFARPGVEVWRKAEMWP
jgi:FkbM family methyltransferase